MPFDEQQAMDEITNQVIGIVGGYVSGKSADALFASFRENVIERWSKKRAKEFVSTFCETIASGSESNIPECLDELFKDDRNSELLFDAYRRVTLSASPVIGPRIIAVVTAKIVSENRQPLESEEQILQAAGSLADFDFEEAKEYFDRFVSKMSRVGNRWIDDGFVEELCSGPSDFWEIGAWAGKLGAIGFLGVSSHIHADSESVVHQGSFVTNAKIHQCIEYSAVFGELIELVSIVQPSKK